MSQHVRRCPARVGPLREDLPYLALRLGASNGALALRASPSQLLYNKHGLRIQKSHFWRVFIGVAYRIYILAVVLQCSRSRFVLKQLKNDYL